MDFKANLARQREIHAAIARFDERIEKRFALAKDEKISYAKCDEHNADDREKIHELASALQALSAELITFLEESLPVVREALGDAYAYQTDSGEKALDELDVFERAACERFEALAEKLGVELD